MQARIKYGHEALKSTTRMCLEHTVFLISNSKKCSDVTPLKVFATTLKVRSLLADVEDTEGCYNLVINVYEGLLIAINKLKNL